MSLPTREIIEAFILRNCVDNDAANSLRDQRPDVQQEVLSRGDVTRHRNPSAALQKHIKEAKLVMNAAARTRHAVALGEMQQFGPLSGYGFSDPLYTYAVGAHGPAAPPPSVVHMLEDRPTAAGPRGRGRGRSPSRSPSFGDAVWRAQQQSPSPEKEMCVNPIFGRRARMEDDRDAASRGASPKQSSNRSRSRRKGEKAQRRSKQEKGDEEPPVRRFLEERQRAKDEDRRSHKEQKRKEKKNGKDQRGTKSEAAKGEREDGRAEDEPTAGATRAGEEELRRKMEDLQRRQDERRQRKEELEQQLLQLGQGDPEQQPAAAPGSSFEDIRQRIDDLQRRQDDRKRRREEVTRQLERLEGGDGRAP